MKLEEFIEQSKRPAPLVSGLILKGHCIVIGGFWGSAKSWIAESLAVSVSSGTPFLGLETSKGKVLIVDEDTPEDTLAERLRRLAKGIGKSVSDLDIVMHSQKHFILSDAKMVRALHEEIVEEEVSLVILDSLSSMLGMLSENDMGAARKQWSLLKGSATLFIVHHFGKKGENFGRGEVSFTAALRGSTKVNDAADTAFSIRGRGWPRVLKVEKQRHALGHQEFAVNLIEDKEKTWARLELCELPREVNKVEKIILPLFTEDRDKLTVDQVAEALAGAASKNEIREALRFMEEKEVIKRGVEAHNRYVYSLRTKATQTKTLKSNEPRKLGL